MGPERSPGVWGGESLSERGNQVELGLPGLKELGKIAGNSCASLGFQVGKQISGQEGAMEKRLAFLVWDGLIALWLPTGARPWKCLYVEGEVQEVCTACVPFLYTNVHPHAHTHWDSLYFAIIIQGLLSYDSTRGHPLISGFASQGVVNCWTGSLRWNWGMTASEHKVHLVSSLHHCGQTCFRRLWDQENGMPCRS